jgi:hypothetical protein
MKSKLATLSLAGTVIASSIVGSIALPSSASAQTSTASCHVYQVNLRGTVVSNYGTEQFSVNQYALWRDRGAKANSVEFLLTTFSDLNASAQVGQIKLMTNSMFAENAGISAARINLARVSSSDRVYFNLDSAASLQLPSPNVFASTGVGNSAGGLGGLGFLSGAGQDLARYINSFSVLSVSYLVPRNGGGSFVFTDNTRTKMAGQIDISGTSPDNFSLQGRYTASFTGNYIGSVACP